MAALATLIEPLLAKVLPLLIGVIAAFVGGLVLQSKIDAGNLDSYKAKYAQEQAAAASAALVKQQAFDADAVAAAQQTQQQQLAIAGDIKQSQQEIIRYVPKTTACVPVGLVSVLKSAIGVSVNGPVSNASVKSDDACSTVGWPQLAAGVIDAFGRARANGNQLNGLIGYINQAAKDNKK